MEYKWLPKQYWEKHDYLLYVYDILGDMLRQADRKELSNFQILIDNDKQAEDVEKTDDIFKWLDENAQHDTAIKMFNSQVFFSLLQDFCFYIYESLSCAERGKVTVAYTLLRKPIRDNLLYLEWLLADKEEFYKTFLFDKVENCDVSNYKVFPNNRIKKIINQASEKSYIFFKI